MSAIDKCQSSRRGGGVKGGAAAERSEGTLDAAEHRAIMAVAMALFLGTKAEWHSGSRACKIELARPSAARGAGTPPCRA